MGLARQFTDGEGDERGDAADDEGEEHLHQDVCRGLSGVNRICRLQPAARSMETDAPADVVAMIARHRAPCSP